MTSRRATALGVGAILLWATLASLTVLSGGLPPFQTTALAFAIGGSVVALLAVVRGRAAAMRPTLPSLALGVYGLFGYHALYFAALRLAPPAEAHLLNSLWAFFIVLFAALLPGHKLQVNHVIGALLGFSAAALLVWSKADDTAAGSSALGFTFAVACALVWSSYSVTSRLMAAVPSESVAISCLTTAVLAFACSALFEIWISPQGLQAWLALVALGAGPVGAAFLLWDIGMKQGNTSLLGVFAYASPVLSTLLLVALGLAEPTWALGAACILMVAGAAVATRGG